MSNKTKKAIKKVNKIFNKTLKNVNKQKGLKKTTDQDRMDMAFKLTERILYQTEL